MFNMTPHQIVEELNRYIIGQDAAKRAVAVALRNRYRRSRLPEELQEEITPKNIIMSGPTGVGKTEIARRLAKLVSAPFIKVEATKYTEVGYVGRDVESMIRDLVDVAVRMVREERTKSVAFQAEQSAEWILAERLSSGSKPRKSSNPFESLFGGGDHKPSENTEQNSMELTKREQVHTDLVAGKLDDELVEIEVEESANLGGFLPGSGMEINVQDLFGSLMPKKTKVRKVKVSEARKILQQEEANRMIDQDEVQTEALRRTEQDGIIFLDEIDKVAGRSNTSGPDVSREGVQRDILPIVEGSTVATKYGPVKTDHILFIAAGAFHISKVSDLIPELQGRFPIRVELMPLTVEDFKKILTLPENAVTKQYQALLSTDSVNISFAADSIEVIADTAVLVNQTSEDLGARRLHTIMEALLEDISFHANGDHPPIDLMVDANYVREHLRDIVRDQDLQRHIL